MDGVITAVEDEFDPTTPSSFRLEQNYPNPFNPSTTIEFALPERSHVHLAVYNVIGQEVAVLADEEKSAGTHRIAWHASGFPSGIYFYRLQTNYRGSTSVIGTKRMIFLK